jgi:hypothetical protein
MRRTPARTEFLSDLFATAMAHGGYGQFTVSDYTDTSAVITFHEDGPEGGTHRVSINTMAHGLRVIRDAVLRDPGGHMTGALVLHNAKTGQRLYFDGDARRNLLLADRTNGKDGDYDVIGALAVLECALFGRVVYA